MPETMTLIEKTVFLSTLELLSGVPTEALAQIAERATEVHAEPGEVLFREGEPDRGTFIVVEGLVELRQGKTVVRVLRPGSEHGEFFLDPEEGHRYSAVALQESHALNIQRDDVYEVLLDYPEFGVSMVRMQALRIERLTHGLVELEAQLRRVTEALERAGIPVPQAPAVSEAVEADAPGASASKKSA